MTKLLDLCVSVMTGHEYVIGLILSFLYNYDETFQIYSFSAYCIGPSRMKKPLHCNVEESVLFTNG